MQYKSGRPRLKQQEVGENGEAVPERECAVQLAQRLELPFSWLCCTPPLALQGSTQVRLAWLGHLGAAGARMISLVRRQSFPDRSCPMRGRDTTASLFAP